MVLTQTLRFAQDRFCGESLKAFLQGAGEAASAAVICANACPTAGTFNLIIFGSGYIPYNFVVDTPVKEVLFVYELYVNFFSC